MRTKCATLALFMVAVIWGPVAFAQQQDAISVIKGKTVILRRPYFSTSVRVGSNGETNPAIPIGTFSLHGLLVIDSAKADSRKLELQARRVLVFLTPDLRLGKIEGKEKVKIVAELDLVVDSDARLATALHKLFQPISNFDVLFADYWKPLVHGKEESEKAKIAGSPVGLLRGAPVYLVREGLVSIPTPIQSPNPEYSALAVKGPISASTWNLVVNENGFPELLDLRESAGVEFDEKAAEALAAWRFKPAKKDGKPVAVRINVELLFKGY